MFFIPLLGWKNFKMVPIVRHFAYRVNNINRVVLILKQLGFCKIYDKKEFPYLHKIIKMENIDGLVVELIKNSFGCMNSTHICFEGDVPNFMKKNKKLYCVEKYEHCVDKNREVFFVYIDDYIYFEFSKEKIK